MGWICERWLNGDNMTHAKRGNYKGTVLTTVLCSPKYETLSDEQTLQEGNLTLFRFDDISSEL